ncbi:MAG: hypothetical protein H5T34_02695 [Candidatus Methanomethyliales bacterium]|nr:hypothetical protein [Candidatus Methanomethylicales archaeon]
MSQRDRGNDRQPKPTPRDAQPAPPCLAEDIYDLEVTHFDNPNNRKCYKAMKERNASASTVFDFLFDILEGAAPHKQDDNPLKHFIPIPL